MQLYHRLHKDSGDAANCMKRLPLCVDTLSLEKKTLSFLQLKTIIPTTIQLINNFVVATARENTVIKS